MSPLQTRTRPDSDDQCAVATTHPAGVYTQFRCRAWRSERLVLVSDSPANRGATVTNAIEQVAWFAEGLMRQQWPDDDVRFVAHPLMWTGWQICQLDALSGRIDLVRFAAWVADDGGSVSPSWEPLPPNAMAWLYASL